LREYADIVDRAASDPVVQALAHGPRRVPDTWPGGGSHDRCRLQTSSEDPAALAPYARKFSTMFVLDSAGCARARISEEPTFPDYVRTTYNWHDYFPASLAHAPQPSRSRHVRAAYRSSISHLIKFAVSAPLFEGDKWTGVVTGSIIAASTLDLPRMKRDERSGQMTVLIGPFEGEPTASPRPRTPSEFTLLVHPSLTRGQKVTLEPTLSAKLVAAFRNSAEAPQFELATALPLQQADYRDPLLGQRWLAAFAPVGATGYVVLVQTRDAFATRPANDLNRLSFILAFGSAALLISYGGFLLWRRKRERGP
jgi:serine/threonine-protein kinase